jgi:hypothetical protein
MRPDELATLRDQVTSRHARGSVAGLAIDCHYLIDQSAMIEPVSVKKPGDAAMMIDVACRPHRPDIPPADLAAELERIWLRDLCLAESEEHAITIGEESITLEFVTIAGDNGPYATGRITIDLRPRKGHKRQRRTAPGGEQWRRE